MNYTELVEQIEAFTENYELSFIANIPNFVRDAELGIYNAVQLANLRKNVTGSLTAGDQYLSLPTDFLSVYSLAVISATGEYSYLLTKDVNFIREAYPNPSVTGVPKHYAIFGPQSANPNALVLLLGPTPSAALQSEFHYFYLPESIVTAGTTWLGDNFEAVLLYGALLQAYTFMKGEEDVLKMYKDQYTNALMMLKGLGDGKQRQDAYRNGQSRVPV